MLDVLQMHGIMISYYKFKTIYETTYVSIQILTYDIGIALTCASQKSIRPSILYIYTIYLSTVAFHRLIKQKTPTINSST